jgi:hypothetical protein
VRKELITKAETERAVLRKHIGGKALFTAMLRLYAALHRELSDTVLSVSAEHKSTEEFREQRRRKRNPSEDGAKKLKTSVPTPESRDPRMRPKGEVPTRNFFAPLRTRDMDLEIPTRRPLRNIPQVEHNKRLLASQAGRLQLY